MSKKILLVEDEALIAMSKAKMLQKHGYEVVTAYNGEKAIETVDSDEEISLILMDIDLGKGMDGTEAAEEILSRHELPIVFLTSHSEKEYVDRVKKITRYGYVLKNSGEFVLIESINMAYELFEAHSEVQEREKRYRSIFYNSHSPMMLIEPATGNIIDVNPAASEFYGWPSEVLSNMKVQDINQLSYEEVLQEMERAREEERNVFYFKHKLSDGAIRDVEVRSSPILIQNRKLLFSIINDVTEKNIAEENLRKSEAQFRNIVEENPEPLFIQTESRFAYLNPAAVKLFGAASASDVIGTPVVDRLLPAFRSIELERIRKLNVERKTVSDKTDLKFLRMDGTSVWVETIGIPIEFKGKQGAIVSVRDITDRKQRERRLQESEENLRTTLNSIGDAVISTDIDGNIVRMNPVAEELTGWPFEAAAGRKLDEIFYIIDADSREIVDNPIEKVMQTGEIVGLGNHTVLISKDRTEYQIADSASPIKDYESNINGVVLVFRDVTEKYEKERQLKESEEKYRNLVENSPIGIFQTNSKGQALHVNSTMAHIVGAKTSEEAITKFQDLSSQLYVRSERRQEFIDELRKNGYVENFEYEAKRLDGKHRWLSMSARTSNRYDDGSFIIDGFTIDITRRKNAEKTVEYERYFLNTVLDNIKEAIIICNEKGEIIRFNESARRLHGLPEKPIPPKQWAEYYDLYYPDGLTPLNTEDVPLYRALNGEDLANIEIMVAPKDGEPHILNCNGRQLLDNEGEKVGAVIAMHDITERKQAEEKLRLKSRFIDRIAEVSPDIFIIYNKNGKYLDIITANEDNLFLKREVMLESKIPEVLPETAASIIIQGIDDALSNNSLKVVEYELEIKNKRLFFEARIIPIDEDKVLSQIIDITERKQAEEELRKSEKKNSAILYALPDLMFIQDSAGTYLDYYASNKDDLYIQPERFIGQNMQDILPQEVYQNLFPLIDKTLSTKEVQIGEYELTVSGENRSYEARFSPYDEDRVVAITRDITEQKQAEKALKKEQYYFQSLLNALPDTVYFKDNYHRFIRINRTKIKEVNSTYEDIIGKTDFDFFSKTAAKKCRADDEYVLNTGNSIIHQEEEIILDKNKKTFLVSKFPLRDEDKNIIGTMGISSDISELKETEEKLKEALEEKDFLMRELNHRVKNNLNMVSSLISLKDSETEDDLSDIKHQIEAISLIHEKFYKTESVSEISCRDYCDDLLNSIFSSFTTQQVRIEKDIENICVPTKTAMSLGLIINEIATNAIKYGFTNEEEAVFSVKMKENKKDNRYELTLSNTGNAFPEEIGLENPETMGLQLISTLIAQLYGTIELQKKPNPVFTIRFPIGEK